MTAQPTIADIATAIWVTWPGEESIPTPAFTLRRSGDDSRRSRAATANRAVSDTDIAEAAQTMQSWGQPALFWVPSDQPDLDAQLERLGYRDHDHSIYYGAPTSALAQHPPPPVTCFEIWEPLAIMADIWSETGTSPGRQEVMARAACPKTAIFGRMDAQPAGAAYVGTNDGLALLHALATLPQHRRKGLGAHMMAQAGIWAARQGCDWLALAVGRDNGPACALYASLGMVPVGSYHYRSLAHA